MATDLSVYDNKWYKPGPFFKRFSWYWVNTIFFKSGLFPFYRLKVFLLKLFGTKIGHGVLIKPFVNIKYPWQLELGDHIWIGEHVWIDNLAKVTIGSHVCLSQGAFLLTGNHDFTKVTFDLIIKPIILEEGVWIGANTIVCPGVVCRDHSLLTVGSVATSDMSSYGIYTGNPAVKVKDRFFET